MIESEGYKAFRGTMKITPKCADREPFTEYADWLYKPEYDCWYGNGRSFMAEICEVVEDETNVIHAHWNKTPNGEYYCSVCRGYAARNTTRLHRVKDDWCRQCGARMDEETKDV